MAGTDRGGRRIRLPALAVVASVLALTAHAVASASTPSALLAGAPAPVIGSVLVLSGAAVGGLGWRRRPWWLVAAVLTVVQSGQHLLLAAAGPQAHPGHTAGHGGTRMLLAHALAASTTAVLLGYGEHAARLLRDRLGWPRPLIAPWPATPLRPLAASDADVWWPVAPAPLRGGLGLRGPPGRSAVS